MHLSWTPAEIDNFGLANQVIVNKIMIPLIAQVVPNGNLFVPF